MTQHVAVDIGASSGRVLLVDKDLTVTEVHRFKNGFSFHQGHDRWDIHSLEREVVRGLSMVKAMGVEECTIGIDTWAVDYCLVDKEGQLLAQPVAYRDHRTQGAMDKVFAKMSKETIYQKTGIQFLAFNTLFQLAVEDPDLLGQTESILLIPDYLAYRLTGIKTCEVTNASTTQLLNLETRDFDPDLLDLIGIERKHFPALIEPGQVIGELDPSLHPDVDLPRAQVIAVATHDTGSAVVGVPAQGENWAYLSSGTWSLIGVESSQPINSDQAFQANYTNEWGANKTYRFLKNITGMWAIQELARVTDYAYSYADMAKMAAEVEPFQQFINLNDDRFTNPDNMREEIQAACRERGEKVPETIGELVMCVYSNLALAYGHEWRRLEALTGKTFEALHIVGGGSNVALLNQLTANIIGKPVIAGPGEATAMGNALIQLQASGQVADLAQARALLAQKTPLQVYQPQDLSRTDLLEQYNYLLGGSIDD